MQFVSFPDYESLSQQAATHVLDFIQKKPNALICIATGNSPKRTYEVLAEQSKKNQTPFKNASIIQLDEWVGLSKDNESSCAYFIQNQVVSPLNIDLTNVFYFDGKTESPNAEIERANQFIDSNNGIDLCILGMGKNGHLGFNEPADFFSKRTHLVPLEEETQSHPMVETLEEKPRFGITLGMEDILKSKKVILMFTGTGKEAVFEKFQSKIITPKVPVSALWEHPNCLCFVDLSAFS